MSDMQIIPFEFKDAVYSDPVYDMEISISGSGNLIFHDKAQVLSEVDVPELSRDISEAVTFTIMGIDDIGCSYNMIPYNTEKLIPDITAALTYNIIPSGIEFSSFCPDDKSIAAIAKIKRADPNAFSAPKQTVPRQEAPQQEAPRQEAPQQAVPQQEAPRQEVPRQEAPQQAVPQQEAPRQEVPRQEAPQQEAPRQEAPQQAVPQQEAPQREAPQQAAPQQEAPRQEAPRQEAPQQAVPQQEAPRQEVPRQAARPVITAESKLILVYTGPKKMDVIKYIKDNFGLSLVAAKDIAEKTPSVISEHLSVAEFNMHINALAKLGAEAGVYKSISDIPKPQPKPYSPAAPVQSSVPSPAPSSVPPSSSGNKLVLIAAGYNKATVIKYIKDNFDLDQHTAKNMAENTPSIITDSLSSIELNTHINSLARLGAKAERR